LTGCLVDWLNGLLGCFISWLLGCLVAWSLSLLLGHLVHLRKLGSFDGLIDRLTG
jgi:hypothetical protein